MNREQSGHKIHLYNNQMLKCNALNLCIILSAPLVFTCTAKAAAPLPLFSEISSTAGLNFQHFNGMTGKYYFPEMTGQGGGFVDYDNDGDLDIYLLQGSMLGQDETAADALYPPQENPPQDKFYRNDSSKDERGNTIIRFTDVTAASNIQGYGYGMGLAVGDFNNDGFADIYITNYGPNKMLYNNGDGTFRDATAASGTADEMWGSSAAALDYDGDGWLDLYVANYVYFDIGANKRCYAGNSRRDYCGPSAFDSQKDRLFHNRGDGTFEDVTLKILENYQPGSGLGVISFDADNNGWLDLYVTNDGQPNQLWINRQGKRFTEDALFSGAAVNQNGQAEASMGIAAGDFDNDGDEDLFMTHIMGETNTLFTNDGSGLFEDRTIAVGLSAISFPYTAFGVNWVDYDNDSWLDLFIASGAVLEIESLVLAKDPYPLHQPNQLLKNIDGKKFIDISAEGGEAMRLSEVSRGAAMGDVDNDGDPDILVANNNGPVRLLINNIGNSNNWLGLRLVDAEHGSDQIGSRVIVHRPSRPSLLRQSRTEGSYCAANDPRILVGLGAAADVSSIDILWSDGSRETWNAPVTGRYTTLTKGKVNQ